MDNLESLKGFGAYLKKNCTVLLDMFRAAPFKIKTVVGVCFLILCMIVVFGAPDKSTVANALPDYVPRAEMQTATTSLQRDIDGLSADIHQIRIELNAVEEALTKLSQSKPAEITTGSIKSKKRR